MSERIGIGIIGSGGIATGFHMPGYASIPDQCEIVAVCDVNSAAAEAAAEKFRVPHVYTDYHDLLQNPSVHAVSVTTPNRFHYQPTLDALRAGKHVLCEKPLAMNGAEAREMVRVANETGIILQVALQARFTGHAQFLKSFIDKGHMGDIMFARAKALRRRGVPHWGVFIDKEQQGGGPLIDIGVHILDLTLFFMGYPKPVSATGITTNRLGTDPNVTNFFGPYDRSKFTVEDFAAGFIRFENGAAIALESSFMANIEADTFETQLMGSDAGAIVKGWAGDDVLNLYKEIDGQYFHLKPGFIPKVDSAHTAEVVAFVHAIRENLPSPVPGENGLILNAIFDALYKSAESGREEPVLLG